MAKQHELLAVEGARKGAFEKVLQETGHNFNQRQDLFKGHERTYQPFNDEDSKEAGVADRQAMETTVPQRLDYLGEYLVAYVDTVYQKELTNQQAKADLVYEGETLATGLPVTFLLNLESTLARMRDTLNSTPTHQTGVGWVPDTTHTHKGVLKSQNPEETFKTRKVIKPFELSPATKEHKAQVEKLTEDINVGKFHKQLWSGMITSAQKSDMLARVDKLIEAVRTARCRANEQETVNEKIGEKLYSIIAVK